MTIIIHHHDAYQLTGTVTSQRNNNKPTLIVNTRKVATNLTTMANRSPEIDVDNIDTFEEEVMGIVNHGGVRPYMYEPLSEARDEGEEPAAIQPQPLQGRLHMNASEWQVFSFICCIHVYLLLKNCFKL